jgi:hypothetical protein
MTGRRHIFVAGTMLGSLALVTAACGSTGGSTTASPADGTSNRASATTIAVASSNCDIDEPLDRPSASALWPLMRCRTFAAI